MHDLLRAGGLDRYYALAGNQVAPAVVSDTARSLTWLEPLLSALPAVREGELQTLELDVQGIHCAACVWLMNELFRRRPGAGELTINPTLGTARLQFGAGFDVNAWVVEVERFGYQFGPPRKEARRQNNALALRLGLAAALTINVMLFSVSFHFGLTSDDAEVFRLFTWLTAALSTANVVIGGWPFFRSAMLSLRTRVLHLDLPIALGIALVYATSLAQLFVSGGRGDLAYFDTLNTFITLMLLGRFIQERLLERNRRFLLEDDGAEGIMSRVVREGRVEIIPAPRVVSGDELLVAPGDVVPVDAELLDASARVSTDWVNGESASKTLSTGARITAGSFNAGSSALRAKAAQDFKDSPLVTLLRGPSVRSETSHALWSAVARRWVVTVLGVSALGFFVWWPLAGAMKALNVAVALLVITCPCAVGIAIPLAYELTQQRLRRFGFYGRTSDLLDRLTSIRHVVFDKTGTLTLGRLELAAPLELNREQRHVLWNLVIRSSHPVSAAIARALAHGELDPAAEVVDFPGAGLEWRRSDGTWRVDRRGFTHDGALIAALPTREVMRSDAREELARLARAGFSLHLFSGDSPARTEQLARQVGITDFAGALTPLEKAERVTTLGDEQVLFLGDGVNDALAFQAAHVAGTPAIDRPVMPSRSDFFLVGEGLSSLSTALEGARHLRRVVRRVLSLSLAYNVFAIGFTLAGLMSPVAAAISMPASTLTLLLVTVNSLRARSQPQQTGTSAPPPAAAAARA